MQRNGGIVKLTPRECQIIKLVSTGMSDKEIARELGIAASTVKVHLHHIYLKLGIPNRAKLAFAYHTRFIEEGAVL